LTPLDDDAPDEPAPEGTAPLEEEDFGGPVDEVEPVAPLTVRWNPERGRELVRALVAGALIVLLAILTCAALIAVIAGADGADVRSITEIVLPPVVALCGSAIGFYFGSGRGPEA
jgi:hypothetical protein